VKPHPRIYTREEASAAIPKLLDLFPKLRYLRDQVIKERNRCDVEEITSYGLKGNLARDAREKMDALRTKVRTLEEDMEKSVRVFDGMDCELKGIDPGLVDFYTERKGQLVYLCWKESEPQVSYWHTIDGGFKSRTPLP